MADLQYGAQGPAAQQPSYVSGYDYISPAYGQDPAYGQAAGYNQDMDYGQAAAYDQQHSPSYAPRASGYGMYPAAPQASGYGMYPAAPRASGYGMYPAAPPAYTSISRLHTPWGRPSVAGYAPLPSSAVTYAGPATQPWGARPSAAAYYPQPPYQSQPGYGGAPQERQGSYISYGQPPKSTTSKQQASLTMTQQQTIGMADEKDMSKGVKSTASVAPMPQIETKPILPSESLTLDSNPWRSQSCLTWMTLLFCFCCPCTYIGMTHFITGKADYNKGIFRVAERRRSSACCWTSLACLSGFVLWLGVGYMLIIYYDYRDEIRTFGLPI